MNTSKMMTIGAVLVIAAQVLGNAALGEEVGLACSGIRFTELLSDPTDLEIAGEWIEIANVGTATETLGGWTLSDQDGAAELAFPEMKLAPGQFVVVHTGAGANCTDAFGTAHFYLNRTSAVWNNAGDDALLTDADGDVVDFFSYGNGTGLDSCLANASWPHADVPAGEGFSLALADEPVGAWFERVPSPGRANGLPAYHGSIKLAQVCYAPLTSGEFVTIANDGNASLDVSDWMLSDGEGVCCLPAGASVAVGGCVTVAENATKYAAALGTVPDFELANLSCPDTGFGLANDGDEVFLLDPWGFQCDAYAYGDSEYVGRGWAGPSAGLLAKGKISARTAVAGGHADTNQSADWDAVRELEANQTAELATSFGTSNVTALAFPDAGMSAILDLLGEAEGSIDVNMYEFTVAAPAIELAEAARRGVDVRVLVEGEPVGGFTSRSAELCDLMSGAGVSVRLMKSHAGVREAYRFDHAKYFVVDGRTLFVGTENWSPCGLPADGTAGNRGWGVVVRDVALAGYFAGVFEADWQNHTAPWEELSGAISVVESQEPSGARNYTARFPPMNVSATARVRPVLSPDTSLANDTILGMIRAAEREICVEQLYVHKDWSHAVGGSVAFEPNPYLEEILDSARRGVGVRILLDSTMYDGEPSVNEEAVRYVNTIAALENLNASAKLVKSEAHGFVKIHAKGMVVDGEAALVSSINWGRNSAVENREAGLIIESPPVAAFFMSVFDWDWADDVLAPVAVLEAPAEAWVNYSVELRANGSWDDKGVASYTWTVDGRSVSTDDDVLYWIFLTDGNHTVRLDVADEWGNLNWTETVVSTRFAESCVEASVPGPVFVEQSPAVDDTASRTNPGISAWTLCALAAPGVAMVAGWLASSRAQRKPKAAKPAAEEATDGNAE